MNVVQDPTTGTNALAGLGPLGFPDFDAIGEGSFAVLFDIDQSEVGFTIVGHNGGEAGATINFYERDGSFIQTIVVSGNGEFAFRRHPVVADIAGFSIHNNDPGGIGYDDFRFDANQPPVADAGTDQTEDQATTITLNGSLSDDPDGDIIRYTWTENSVVVAETTGSPAAAMVVVNLSFGVHTITLEVEDDEGKTDTDEVVITVTFDADVGGIADVVNEAGEVVGSLNIPPEFFEGTDPVTLTVVVLEPEDCPAELSGEGLCLTITTDGTVADEFAIVGLCFSSDPSAAPLGFAIFRTDGNGTTVLQNVDTLDCGEIEASSNLGANPLTRFASGLWQKVTAPFRPQALQAAFGHFGTGRAH